MTTVRINYNPYKLLTRLYIDGKEAKTETSKVLEFIEGREICEWLLPCKVSKYREWGGIIPELVYATNDDELTIEFEGWAEDFAALKNAIDVSIPKLESEGWKTLWVVKYTSKYEITDMKERLAKLVLQARELCQTRLQLTELDDIWASINRSDNLMTLSEQINVLEAFFTKNVQEATGEYVCAEEALWRQMLSIYSKIIMGE